MPVFALVDCNNFYASCERAFRPALEGRPVVVLSNNDGCVIARSNEAKSLGIPMGAPFFQWRDFCRVHGVELFSSNYELYGDMSARVMSVLRDACPEIEIYSIDEAFLRLDAFASFDLLPLLTSIRARVRQWTGIPVSIGIGPTKTLAKLANKLAKKGAGVFSVMDEGDRAAALARFHVADIWGVGRQTTDALAASGITTAAQLRDADPKRIRQRSTVVAERIIYELRGQACLDLEDPQPRKNIVCSRMFGQGVADYEGIAEAVSCYATRAAEKLRSQHSRAQAVQVFIQTSRFRPGPQHFPTATAAFDHPSSDSFAIVRTALQLARRIYARGYSYTKAGIMLLDLVPQDYQQSHLFADDGRDKADRLMRLLDGINRRMGKGTLFLASQGIRKSWAMQRNLKSPCYSTRLTDIPTAT